MAGTVRKDEGAKWFGLVVEKSGQDRIVRIVETPRFSNLIEDSMHSTSNSPSRQYPGIVSFVGDTGAGKSTLSKTETLFQNVSARLTGFYHSSVFDSEGLQEVKT